MVVRTREENRAWRNSPGPRERLEEGEGKDGERRTAVGDDAGSSELYGDEETTASSRRCRTRGRTELQAIRFNGGVLRNAGERGGRG